jgi:hypothetical protein
MKLPVVRRILREDLAKAGEVPSYLDALLTPLNQFIDQVANALRNNLSFDDNFAGKTFSAGFQHNTELQISPLTTRKVSGVLWLDCNGEGVDKFKWVRKDNGNIGITFTFSSAPSGTINCTIVMLFGGT